MHILYETGIQQIVIVILFFLFCALALYVFLLEYILVIIFFLLSNLIYPIILFRVSSIDHYLL